jgi:hypothetical protein
MSNLSITFCIIILNLAWWSITSDGSSSVLPSGLRSKSLRGKYRNDRITTINPEPIDFNSLKKANWRTKFKLSTACAKCGSTLKLENHHTYRRNEEGSYPFFVPQPGGEDAPRRLATLGRWWKEVPAAGNFLPASLTVYFVNEEGEGWKEVPA